MMGTNFLADLTCIVLEPRVEAQTEQVGCFQEAAVQVASIAPRGGKMIQVSRRDKPGMSGLSMLMAVLMVATLAPLCAA